MLERIAIAAVFSGIALFGLRGVLPDLSAFSDLGGMGTAAVWTLILAGTAVVIYQNITAGMRSRDRSGKQE